MTKDLRWYDGAFYQYERLAFQANVSKATIDYYTSLELLETNSYDYSRNNIQSFGLKQFLNYQEVTPFLLKSG